jgi:hypothetical protein
MKSTSEPSITPGDPRVEAPLFGAVDLGRDLQGRCGAVRNFEPRARLRQPTVLAEGLARAPGRRSADCFIGPMLKATGGIPGAAEKKGLLCGAYPM